MDNTQELVEKLRKKYIDTYDALSPEERDELIIIQKIKSNIKYFIGIDNIISKLVEIIDEQSIVSFASERNKKYISTVHPLFILKINKKEITENLEYLKNDATVNDYFINNKLNPKYEKDVRYIQDYIKDNVVAPYAQWVMSYLEDNEKFTKICVENGLSEEHLKNKALDIVSKTSAVMFAIKVDLKNNKIFLEYAV